MVSREGGGAMNKEEIKGKIEEIKGELKEKLGGALRDRKTQAEGLVEEQKGKVQEKIGELKENAERKEPEEQP
jgi:uncharacterized protein YjbJ (UPF0337 family)